MFTSATGHGNLAFAFMAISLAGLLFGYIIGINSSIVISGQLQCRDGDLRTVNKGTWGSFGYNQCYELDALQVGLFSSVNIVGALLSTLYCFRFSDDLGRKFEVQLAAALYLSGAAMASLSPVLWGIYAGFLVYGLGVGFGMHAAPVYIAEVAPAELRGPLISAKEAIIVLGMCLGFLGGLLFLGHEVTGWRWMVGGSMPFALVMGWAIRSVPESPRFLVLRSLTSEALRGRDKVMTEAVEALKYFRQVTSNPEVETELGEMRNDLEKSLGSEAASFTDAFKYPALLWIGCGIVFLQQVTGQPSVLYFVSTIFKSGGLGSLVALSSLLVGVVKLLATAVSAGRVDTSGRRVLLFVGISTMAVALAIMSLSFSFRTCAAAVTDMNKCEAKDLSLPRGWGLTSVVGMMLYVSGYQLGFGPISWVLISEIFPLRVRGAALSLSAAVNFSTLIIMTVLQPVLLEAMGPARVFFGYGVLCLLSLAFVHRYVPESKGKTLEELETMLAAGKLE